MGGTLLQPPPETSARTGRSRHTSHRARRVGSAGRACGHTSRGHALSLGSRQWTGHRTQSESPQAGQPREISEPAKMCQILPFQYMSLIVLRSNCLPKKKGMFKRERTCDLMILNSVTLLGGFGTRSSLARVSFSLCPACQATRRLRGDGSARPRHSPSRRGVTPACPEGPGSTRRSAGHKTTGIRKRAFAAGRRGQPDPTVLGAPGLGREDAPPDGDLATRPRLPPGPGAPDIRPGARHTRTCPQLSLSAP